MSKYKKLWILIHAFISVCTNDYAWLSITNNQQQIVQDVQLLGCWAGLHPSITALWIMLSNSVALVPSNYISTLHSYIFLLLQAQYFSSWDWWHYVNCLYLRHETFFIINSLSGSTSFSILFLSMKSKTFLSTCRLTTCQHILQKLLNVLIRTSQISEFNIL